MTTKLAKYLATNELSQAAFARRYGFKTPTLCQWASAERIPSLDNALALEIATGGAVPARYWQTVRRKPARRATPGLRG